MKILAIDGNSIINRAFYGVRPLTTKRGEFTNAVYGFFNITQKLIDDSKPDAVAVAFDLKAPTFRHNEYSDYKAGRRPMPDELASQFPLVKELVKKLGYKCIECEGYEADDILGTLSAMAQKDGWECVIATGDRDSFQLISDNTSVSFATTKGGTPDAQLYNAERINEEFGISPKQLIDVKAIEGDKSDNIPGVAGIGKVGALKLIKSFGSLDGVYENIDSPEIKEGMRKKLIESKDNAYLSLKLGRIICDAPIGVKLNELVCSKPDKSELKSFLTRLELFKAISRLKLDDVNIASEDVSEETEKQTFEIAVTNDIASLKGDIYCFADDDIIGLCNENKLYTFDFDEEILKSLGRVSDRLITFDYKTLCERLLNKNISCGAVAFDAVLAAYLLNPSAGDYSFERLCDEYRIADFSVVGDDLPAAHKAAELALLCGILKAEIDKNGLAKLLSEIEIPLASVLAEMEYAGFEIDSNGVKDFGVKLDERIEVLENDIYSEAGEEFNLNSPKQLGHILFEKLMLPVRKKTKSGYSTNAEVLESLRGYSPIIDAILEYRQLSKLKSTYVDGLLKVVSDDGRIHSKLNQTETRTGRISSSEPNLQNIPVRSELGREMRRFFIAPEGRVLVDADYSQIELRVLAHIADDKTMIEAFNNGVDIHTLTASQVFGMPEMLVDSSLRSKAKAVNFGIVYGIGAFSLSKDIGVSRAEADRYIKGYLSTYSGVSDYMDKTIKKAKADGYVVTEFGRKRYLPELSSSNANMRNFGERVARNAPIQGTAADIIKIAMINVSKRLKAEKLNAQLIMQVHDELIIECDKSDADKVAEILKYEMENAVHFKVKMTVDTHYGKNWYDAKG